MSARGRAPQTSTNAFERSGRATFVTIDRLQTGECSSTFAGSEKRCSRSETARGLGRLDIEKPRGLFTCFNRLLGQTLKSSTVSQRARSQYMMRICDRDPPNEAFWRQTLRQRLHHLGETTVASTMSSSSMSA